MDPQKRLALELTLEDRLRDDLGALSVRPYAYYKEAALRRNAAGPRPIGRLLSLVRAGATLAVAALIAFGAALILLNLRGSGPAAGPTPSPTLSITPSPTLSITPSPTERPTASPQPGAITGRLEYPAEGIPALTVYAISTTDQRIWYSVDVPQFPNPAGTRPPPGTFAPGTEPRYTITGIAPGTYVVLAYRNDGQRPDPGGYTRAAATCRGPQPVPPPPACNDHSLMPVAVTAGQTTSGIDVTDWVVGFGQPSPSIPPRPTPR